MNIHQQKIIFSLVCSAMLISFAVSSRAQDDRAAIDQVRIDFNTAYNAGDAEGMGALIAPDGIWMAPGQPAVSGHDTIKGLYASVFAELQSAFELHAGNIEVCGDCAYLCGSFTRTDTTQADAAGTTASGNYLFVLKKQSDGSWKIARDIWNERTER